LFIPSFIIVTGLLIEPIVVVGSIVDHLPLALGIIVALLAGKWIAAAVVGRAFGYPPAARSTIWALTLPQVAATLAAALVAYDAQCGARPHVGHLRSRAGPDGALCASDA
jgi:Kef-type K+ transport system membrane component KefB